MNFLAVQGKGDPNAEDGAYRKAVGLLYAVAFTIKMSKLGSHKLAGYFDYVMPPLEGLWWQDGIQGVDYSRKQDFRWISLLRLPEFATPEVVEWAVREASDKKNLDCSAVKFFPWREGFCVQCLHVGPYDAEPSTVSAMEIYTASQGCTADFGEGRFHHEIYLSDPRRCHSDRLKTVIRQPIRKRL